MRLTVNTIIALWLMVSGISCAKTTNIDTSGKIASDISLALNQQDTISTLSILSRISKLHREEKGDLLDQQVNRDRLFQLYERDAIEGGITCTLFKSYALLSMMMINYTEDIEYLLHTFGKMCRQNLDLAIDTYMQCDDASVRSEIITAWDFNGALVELILDQLEMRGLHEAQIYKDLIPFSMR
jgi:hypothetical protein